jgi:hypothetical protein
MRKATATAFATKRHGKDTKRKKTEICLDAGVKALEYAAAKLEVRSTPLAVSCWDRAG